MLTEFTFICICYNQQDVITEHLNSIKALIETYGQGVKNYLILADDHSKDSTVMVSKDWIESHTSLFEKATILSNESNVGTVKNILNAVDACKTKEFKILAGDDKYSLRNIYELYSTLEDEIVVTPVIPFGDFGTKRTEIIRSFKRSYALAMDYCSINRMSELMTIRNYIIAPGAFVPSDYWRDSDVREALSHFKYVEDAPMWTVLINEKGKKLTFNGTPYICYRVAGDMTLTPNKDSDIRAQDRKRLNEVFPYRLSGKRKYLQYAYYRYLVKKTMDTFSKSFDGFFYEDSEVRRIYIDSVER